MDRSSMRATYFITTKNYALTVITCSEKRIGVCYSELADYHFWTWIFTLYAPLSTDYYHTGLLPHRLSMFHFVNYKTVTEKFLPKLYTSQHSKPEMTQWHTCYTIIFMFSLEKKLSLGLGITGMELPWQALLFQDTEVTVTNWSYNHSRILIPIPKF